MRPTEYNCANLNRTSLIFKFLFFLSTVKNASNSCPFDSGDGLFGKDDFFEIAPSNYSYNVLKSYLVKSTLSFPIFE